MLHPLVSPDSVIFFAEIWGKVQRLFELVTIVCLASLSQMQSTRKAPSDRCLQDSTVCSRQLAQDRRSLVLGPDDSLQHGQPDPMRPDCCLQSCVFWTVGSRRGDRFVESLPGYWERFQQVRSYSKRWHTPHSQEVRLVMRLPDSTLVEA